MTATRPDTPTPAVPVSSFDFLDQVWRARGQTRRLNRVTATVAALAITVTAAGGYTLSSSRSQVARDAANAAAEAQLATQQLAALTGGVTDLPGHLTTRRDETYAALGRDVDGTDLVTRLFVSAPAGVTILAAKVSGPGIGLGATASTTTTVALGRDDAAPATTAPAPAGYTVEVTASAGDFAAASVWRANLEATGVFRNVVVTPTGGTDAITLTLSADVDEAAAQTRLADAHERLGDPTTTTTVPTEPVPTRST